MPLFAWPYYFPAIGKRTNSGIARSILLNSITIVLLSKNENFIFFLDLTVLKDPGRLKALFKYKFLIST